MTTKKFHCCLFDLECWKFMWLYGAPMRVHWFPRDKFWEIPILVHLVRWRSKRVWDWENAVSVLPEHRYRGSME